MAGNKLAMLALIWGFVIFLYMVWKALDTETMMKQFSDQLQDDIEPDYESYTWPWWAIHYLVPSEVTLTQMLNLYQR